MATESSGASQPGPEQPTMEAAAESAADGQACDTDLEGSTEDVPEEQSTLSLDVAFDIVKNERRRLVLKYLAERDDGVTLGELAEHIAAIENDKDVQAINSTERKRVYVGLYQCHLPKMDSAGVVESERNSNIRLGENADAVMQYVDFEEETRPWHRYYLGLSILGLFAVTFAGVTGFGVVSSAVPGAVILAMFVMATVHTKYSPQ